MWDGKEGCEHTWGDSIISKANDSNRGTMEWTTGGNPAAKVLGTKVSQGQFCKLCGAWRGAYGQETSVELYIRHSMTFLAECWRVLRDDGVVFWNIGDGHSSGSSGHVNQTLGGGAANGSIRNGRRPPHPDFRAKSLFLVPERFAIAAQEAGWIVRDRIAWVKKAPMPESVVDRMSKSWEVIYMLTKSERYWWDQEAVRERQTGNAHSRGTERNTESYHEARGSYTGFKSPLTKLPNGRNLRNAWILGPEPYPDAHFATFPTEIPRRCILAACPEAICRQCGKARERIVERTGWINKREPAHVPNNSPTKNDSTGWAPQTRATDNWTVCPCNAGFEPGLVLDPFTGSGTTVMVAQQLGRLAVGVDLSAAYIALAQKRVGGVGLPLNMEGV